MSGTSNLKSNIPLFIAFRVRFIDFGLTIGQYALLNVALAAATFVKSLQR